MIISIIITIINNQQILISIMKILTYKQKKALIVIKKVLLNLHNFKDNLHFQGKVLRSIIVI